MMTLVGITALFDSYLCHNVLNWTAEPNEPDLANETLEEDQADLAYRRPDRGDKDTLEADTTGKTSG
jgi:hypothetical protein